MRCQIFHHLCNIFGWLYSIRIDVFKQKSAISWLLPSPIKLCTGPLYNIISVKRTWKISVVWFTASSIRIFRFVDLSSSCKPIIFHSIATIFLKKNINVISDIIVVMYYIMFHHIYPLMKIPSYMIYTGREIVWCSKCQWCGGSTGMPWARNFCGINSCMWAVSLFSLLFSPTLTDTVLYCVSCCIPIGYSLWWWYLTWLHLVSLILYDIM